MTACLDLRALLVDPTRAADLPVADVTAFLDAIGREAARLDVLKTILAFRLAALSSNRSTVPPDSDVGPLTQEEAAARYRMPLRKLRYLTRTQRVASYKQGR